MLLAKTVWLQSGDDETITIEIATECLPADLVDNYVYWELRRALNGEAVLYKSTVGTELLPPETTPDIVVDYATNTIYIYLGEYETYELYGEYFQYIYLRNKQTNKKQSLMYGVVGFLENPDTEYPVVTYTTPELVTRQLRMTSSDGSNLILTEDSDPSRSLVIEYIRQSETRIDRESKNSWRENQVVDEMHDIPNPLGGVPLRDVVINLRYSKIRPWDPEEGDDLLVMQSGSWVSYTTMAQAVQGSTWWIDYNIGQLHFNDFWPWFFSGENHIKITYRWGDVQSEVPTDIQEACTKMVGIRLIQSEFNKIMLYNRASNPVNWDRITVEWEKDIKEIIAMRRRRIIACVTR
jgi:hypothetical protein